MRKFKSGNTKLAFGTVLCGADSPDWRYKLLGKKEDSLVSLFYCYWNDGWLAAKMLLESTADLRVISIAPTLDLRDWGTYQALRAPS